ncbi:YqiA/YcfP family alpha/beta fold hydrolase [Salinicola aestuarinus]|uniref:YqiA/YcfP family alpha/beta fold hydrolase n=1 Tax=Salinicola aestuarinus TaxID=1949082 RepID=UPI001FDA2164|nr:YqiA/YcfP family alpha/beta fold hydrolase [Salinicola aestuarinus]
MSGDARVTEGPLGAVAGPSTPVSSVLYLHGFNSAAASPKARLIEQTCRHLEAESGEPLACLAPDLSHQPATALARAEACLDTLAERNGGLHNTLLIGSSMGGFLATCLAERHGLRAALINPAVAPARLVADYLGATLTNPYTEETFTIGDAHRDELEAMMWSSIVDPERYLVLLGSADETLDCRDALGAYAGARTLIEPGGDHGFSRLAAYLPAIFAHGGWTLPSDVVPRVLVD